MLDYLIIGQGLAGSLLAWELIRRGLNVAVMDNGHRDASSRVAAGLINPVTGLRLVKSPHTEVWLRVATETYADLEAAFGRRIYHPLPMWRLFTQAKQQQAWRERLTEAAYGDYLGEIQSPERALPYRAERGFAEVRHTAYIDTKALLEGARRWLQAREALLASEVDYAQIRPGAESVRYEGLVARRLVFCEGWRGVDNPWFGYLPLSPVKGEILTLQHQGRLPPVIANFGKWLLPLARDRFKLGASYDWRHRDQRPTEQARVHLMEALETALHSSLETELLAHEAGLRPNTRDRLPLLGAHPSHPRLWIFNGFGSKGAMMIPYYARHLAEHLDGDLPLAAHCDIGRWHG